MGVVALKKSVIFYKTVFELHKNVYLCGKPRKLVALAVKDSGTWFCVFADFNE